MFQKAVKHEAKLRLALVGPPGAGKTYTALTVAKFLGGKVAVVDTEHGSASKYADDFDFDTCPLSAPYNPQRFLDAIRAAAQAGYTTVILDSLTHAWSGTGGLLEMVDQEATRKHRGNSFQAWGTLGTPTQNNFIDGMLAAPIHIIATMRSKTEYVVEKDERTGKSAPRKVGLAPQQRDGFEYEFDVVGHLDNDNTLIIQKTRCSTLQEAVIKKPGESFAHTLKSWLVGAPVPVANQQVVADKPAPSPEQVLKNVRSQVMSPEQVLKNVRSQVMRLGIKVCGTDNLFYQWLADRDLAPYSEEKGRVSLTSITDLDRFRIIRDDLNQYSDELAYGAEEDGAA